ncbi:MAG: GerMN domain-containing protein [Candidatus Eremiobacteraeota bacterium]|nr:GerMN domain-containing protein [Candidatus Eremiobacteraeota bacterium]
MSNSRIFFLLGLFVLIAVGAWLFLAQRNHSPVGDHLTVYYTNVDGKTVTPWTVSMRPQQSGEAGQEHLHNAALYAAVQAVAGPPSTTDAIRFPAGTQVRTVSVTGSTAEVDLSGAVKSPAGGSFGESGEFKALVWTLTGLPGIDSVRIRVDGQRLDALPGGHFELDKPLHRADW